MTNAEAKERSIAAPASWTRAEDGQFPKGRTGFARGRTLPIPSREIQVRLRVRGQNRDQKGFLSRSYHSVIASGMRPQE